MRIVSAQHAAAWRSGQYIGDQKPMQRATIQKVKLATVGVRRQVWATVPFAQHSRPRELPNVKSIQWQRAVDGDAGSCTLTLYNTKPLTLGETPEEDGDLDLPGYYTFNRGRTTFTSRWGQEANAWQNFLAPDRLIRTYEGYGFNPDEKPEDDAHMYPSGVWLIDDVQYTTDGLITVKCRDLTRLLIDQVMFPPVVPMAYYPLHFEHYHQVANPPVVNTTGAGWSRPDLDGDSEYTGHYVSAVDSPVYGHYPHEAFDGSDTSYWLSTGNAQPGSDYAFEWVQGSFSSRTLTGVKAHVHGGPYRVYLSVFSGGQWRGSRTIPYNPSDPISAPNDSNVSFIATDTVDANGWVYFKFADISGATKVRLTFTDLWNSGLGPYPYRAAVRDFQITSSTTTTTTGGTHTEGNYGDYTDIVRQLLGYGGFYWPKNSDLAITTKTSGDVVTTPAPEDNSVMVKGTIWGELEPSGTFGPSAMGVEIWDKKPLIDGVTYVRDILGFIFWVDEYGSAIFRSPNVWKVGNYLNGSDRGDGAHVTRANGSGSLIVIDELTTLKSLTATLSSHSIREKVLVANTTGKIGAVAPGHFSKDNGPFHANLRRVAGWTDQHFTTKKECQIMADLISLRQLFTYRTDHAVIPGYCAIQIDDQVRILEGTTSDDYIHYVTGITSDWDIETGVWTYTLDTHWLGESAFSNWVFDPDDMAKETRDYLKALGKI